MKVTIEPQPREFIGQQAPEARRRLREALHQVEAGKTFPAALEDDLEGFYKLKPEGFRFILQHVSGGDGPFFRVVFCERRSVVYELFKQTLGLE